MRISQYHPEYDQKHLEAMLRERDLPKSALNELPELGYIFFDGNRPIAAGFLRKCEGEMGIIDSFITSPGEPPELRNKALDILTKRLVHTANKLGISKLLAFSLDQNTIMRGLRHGFEATTHVIIIKKGS